MKTLIVFLGIAVLHIALLTWQSDCTRFSDTQAQAGRLAKECAAGAVMYFEAEAYAQGHFVIDETAARQFAQDYQNSLTTAGLPASGETAFAVQVENQAPAQAGGVPEPDGGQGGEPPCVAVSLTYKGEDFFRLPFLQRDEISAHAVYETVGR